MAAQGFIQPMAQGAQQTIPNNGNPNTVYNMAPSGAAVNGWASNPITPAANAQPTNIQPTIDQSNQQIAQSGWAAPAASAAPQQQGVLQLPEGWADQLKAWQPQAAPAAKAYDLDKEWLVNDNGVPRRNPDLYQNDPAYRAAWDQIYSEHQARMGKSIEDKRSDANAMTTALRQYYQMYYDNGWRPDETYLSTQGQQGNVRGVNSQMGDQYYANTTRKK